MMTATDSILIIQKSSKLKYNNIGMGAIYSVSIQVSWDTLTFGDLGSLAPQLH